MEEFGQYVFDIFKDFFPETCIGKHTYDELEMQSILEKTLPLELMISDSTSSPVINRGREYSLSADATTGELSAESSEDDERSDNDEYEQLLSIIRSVREHVGAKRSKDAENLVGTIVRPHHITEEHIEGLRDVLRALRLMLAPKERWRARLPNSHAGDSLASSNPATKRQYDDNQDAGTSPIVPKRKRGRPRKTQTIPEKRGRAFRSPRKRSGISC